MTDVIEHPVHWPRGGSISDRIVPCHGCVNEAEQYPADPSTSYAIDGTHDHSALELALNHNIVDARLLKGRVYRDHEGEYEVTDERAARVNVALEYVNRKMRNSNTLQLWTERFVDAGQVFGIPGWGGSADIILFDPNHQYLEVIDYKGGGRPVSPETYQMVTYGIGARALLPDLSPSTPTVCTIIQPKVSREPKSVTYSPMEWDVKVKILADAMRKSLDPNAARVAGDHCRYCRGAKPGRCPEFNETANKGVRTMFDNTPQLGLQTAPLQIPVIGEQSTNEELAAILDAEPLIKSLIKEAQDEAIRRAREGQRIPGRKLVRGTTQRRWTDDAFETLSSMRVKAEVYSEKKLKSPAKVVDSDEFKSLSETQQKKISALVVKPEGPLKLVPESDPGKAIAFDAASLFPDTVTTPVEETAPVASLSFL